MQVTFIEALDQLMPGFDPEIGKLAQRVLINPRKIDYHTGVFATKVILLSINTFVDSGVGSGNLYSMTFYADNSSKGW